MVMHSFFGCWVPTPALDAVATPASLPACMLGVCRPTFEEVPLRKPTLVISMLSMLAWTRNLALPVQPHSIHSCRHTCYDAPNHPADSTQSVLRKVGFCELCGPLLQEYLW